MHKFAHAAARAALAAHKQGKFWQFHDKLFENYNKLNDEFISEIAKESGLDMEQFNKSLQDPEIAKLVNRDLKEGYAMNVRGTPSLFINGRTLKNRSLKGFQEMIDGELKKIGSEK